MQIIDFKKIEGINKRVAGTLLYLLKKIENKCVKDKKCCKVKNNCHYTREYRGASSSICNLKYSVPKKFL